MQVHNAVVVADITGRTICTYMASRHELGHESHLSVTTNPP
jgi:hypothetical protein